MAIKQILDDFINGFRAQSPWVIFYFGFWFCYFSYFWFFVFEYNEQGGLTVGQANMWADWALHFTMGHAMAYRELFLEQSPLLINSEFSYPFAINLISALLLKFGMAMIPAFVIPSYLFSILLVFALYFFLNALFNNKTIAVLGAFLFFFNGGIGFVYFIQDILSSTNTWDTLINPPKEYTHLADKQIKWISIINSIILPQRSFTMGFGLTLLALAIVVKSFQLTSTNGNSHISKNYYWSAFILGLMPIIHMHSFLAAFIFLCCWSISDLIAGAKQQRMYRLKHWSLFAILTTLISLPLLYHYYFGHIGGSFIKWFPGWFAKEFNINWFLFWFKNWTLVPLLALLGFVVILAQSIKNKTIVRQLGLFIPAFIIFAVVNLIILQPWIWDNTKLLAWTAVVFSGLTAWLLFHFIKWKDTCFIKNLVMAVLFVVITSGAIDIYRNIQLDNHRFQMYSKTELELAQWVKENTLKDSVWLVSNTHNHWLFNLTGRQAVITYDGWLWSHGYDYLKIKKDVDMVFKGADTNRLMKYDIDYVVLESKVFKGNPFLSMLWHKKYKLVHRSGDYRIFKVSY